MRGGAGTALRGGAELIRSGDEQHCSERDWVGLRGAARVPQEGGAPDGGHGYL